MHVHGFYGGILKILRDTESNIGLLVLGRAAPAVETSTHWN